ncbi:zinc-binding alcohol dehydrogenase family protein [Salinicoccus halitifaciens]|uniref:L-gulonate 5-dehydrogenase n=1 Tax=Salinicoccus halitifaciens TaxID=1073415 RepID=A0ABV2E8L8_9STAP|nr:zinc-binding alcohol dehydrogenase family protein [Salinicoccus halitifaciens]MCD2136445.1 zinc-binding alcohol dehydrogenase family protein [Salinicoccus halitifaciens]
MKQVLVKNPQDIQIVEAEEIDKPQRNEVKVKVIYAGLCGSDVHIFEGHNPFATYPRIIGHEVMGVVEEVGEDVSDLESGDQVILEPIKTCGECRPCRIGRPNICENLQVYGVHRDGGMQEYFVIESDKLHKISSEVTPEKAVLAEPLTIGAQASLRGEVGEGDTVLIQGAGTIGLCCLLIAKHKGATVIVSDLDDDKLQFAEDKGADYTINIGENNLLDEVFKITEDKGVNVSMDAVGLNATFESAVKSCAPAGKVVVLGFEEKPAQVSQVDITKGELDVRGSRLQTDQFPYIISLLEKNLIDVDGIVTHIKDKEEINDALELFKDNSSRKILIKF